MDRPLLLRAGSALALAALALAGCDRAPAPTHSAATSDTGQRAEGADVSAQLADLDQGDKAKDEITATDPATGYDGMAPSSYRGHVDYHPPRWGAEAIAARAAQTPVVEAIDEGDEGDGGASGDTGADTSGDSGDNSQ